MFDKREVLNILNLYNTQLRNYDCLIKTNLLIVNSEYFDFE